MVYINSDCTKGAHPDVLNRIVENDGVVVIDTSHINVHGAGALESNGNKRFVTDGSTIPEDVATLFDAI